MKKTLFTLVMVATICFSMEAYSLPTTVEKIIEDPVGDVKNLDTNETVDIPCIDIKKVTYFQNGKAVTITLQVAGKIGKEGIEEKYYMYSIVIRVLTKSGNEEKEYDVQYFDIDFGELGGEKMKLQEAVVTCGLENVSKDVTTPRNDTLRACFELKEDGEYCTAINATTMLMAMESLSLLPEAENISKAGTDTLFYEFPKSTVNASLNQSNQEKKENKSKRTPDVGIAGFLIATFTATTFLLISRKLRKP